MTPTSDDLIRQLIAAIEAETEADRITVKAAQGRIDKAQGRIDRLRAELPSAMMFPAPADSMPPGWRPKHWEHVQRKGKGDNGGKLCPRERRPHDGTEERLYPGNDHATRARRLGIGRLNPTGPGVWLTIRECWLIERARQVAP